MGYYDQGFKPRRGTVRQRKSTWLNSIISALIGGLVVLMLFPALSSMDWYPYELKASTTPAQETADEKDKDDQTAVPVTRTTVEVSSDVIEAIERVSDAIVGVINIQQTSSIFGQDMRNSGTGSGVIFAKEDGYAYVVTNHHVIDRAHEVEVSLADGERVTAELVGSDEWTDLAVLKIDATNVDTVAEFGDSDSIRPGEPAIAIGNPLGLNFSGSVTQGIISAKERAIQVSSDWEINVIQTDAAINPGNSGGALLNIQGQVIGINSLKISQTYDSAHAVEGMGFAIPINDAIPVIEDFMEHGEVRRAVMGIIPQDLQSIARRHWTETLNLPADVTKGVLIRRVEPLSPADRGGLAELDVIVEINGEPIDNSMRLRQYLHKHVKIGDTIVVKYYSGGLESTAELHMTESFTQ